MYGLQKWSPGHKDLNRSVVGKETEQIVKSLPRKDNVQETPQVNDIKFLKS